MHGCRNSNSHDQSAGHWSQRNWRHRALQTIFCTLRRHDSRRDCKAVKETRSNNNRALLNEQQTNKSAKKWSTLANQKAKRQAKAEQNHMGESAQQWHNYACPQRTSTCQQQIFQLTLIINNLIYYTAVICWCKTRFFVRTSMAYNFHDTSRF